jgi:hypothetical protein
MKKSIKDNRKIGRGRPATGTAPLVGVRMTEELQAQIKAWAKNQKDDPPLASAIRRLVEIGLSKSSPKTVRVLSTAKQGAARAAELAADVISDQMPNTSDEEKTTRRRRLITGPSEFRNVRRDR